MSDEIRPGMIYLARNENPVLIRHNYMSVRPYLIVSNCVYNTHSGLVEAIPFSCKRFGDDNPVHIDYPYGEVVGLDKDSTLIIENMTTLPIAALHKLIGFFTEDNWRKAAKGIVVQIPYIKYAFE